MTDENIDLIDHEITIDNYIKVTLSIPKKLTAIELKGIMLKASQLLKMSEITVSTEVRRPYKKRENTLKDKIVLELVNMMETRDRNTSKVKIFKAFGEKHTISYTDVAKRYYYLMGHGLLPKSGSKIASEIKRLNEWVSDAEKMLIDMHKAGENRRDIADAINKKFNTTFVDRSISDKTYKLKKDGILK